MRTAHRTAFASAVAALLLPLLVACSDSNEPNDGQLTIYSGRQETLVGPLLEKFQAASGIEVEVRYGDSAALAAQLLEEGEDSKADVFFAQDAGALGAVAKDGLFAELPADVLNRVPGTYRARTGHWVGITGRSRVFVYNADQVPEADLPTSVFELTEPKWRGKIGIAPTNASFQAFITAIRVQHGEDRARQFLAGLKSNGAQIRESNPLIVQEVNDGKLAAGLVNHYYIYARAKEEGTTLDGLKAKLYFLPNGDTGALVNVAGVGIMKDAGTDNDARKLVDYMLSTEGQTYFATQTSEYPLITGVASPAGLPTLTQLQAPAIDLNDLDTLQTTVQMIKDAGLA